MKRSGDLGVEFSYKKKAMESQVQCEDDVVITAEKATIQSHFEVRNFN